RQMERLAFARRRTPGMVARAGDNVREALSALAAHSAAALLAPSVAAPRVSRLCADGVAGPSAAGDQHILGRELAEYDHRALRGVHAFRSAVVVRSSGRAGPAARGFSDAHLLPGVVAVV